MTTIACRAIILFIEHVSLVRPLGEGGILRLVVDFAQIELALSPFCRRLTDLGKHYKILKAFRSLLILNVEEFQNNSSIGDVVPYDIVLHHLFSRAPTEMRSPHQVEHQFIFFFFVIFLLILFEGNELVNNSIYSMV